VNFTMSKTDEGDDRHWQCMNYVLTTPTLLYIDVLFNMIYIQSNYFRKQPILTSVLVSILYSMRAAILVTLISI